VTSAQDGILTEVKSLSDSGSIFLTNGVCVCAYMCVCEGERDRPRKTFITHSLFHVLCAVV
jgi:hypothetical protein